MTTLTLHRRGHVQTRTLPLRARDSIKPLAFPAFDTLHEAPDDASLGPSAVDEAEANLEDGTENPPSVQLESDTPGRSEPTDHRQTKDQTNPQRTH